MKIKVYCWNCKELINQKYGQVHSAIRYDCPKSCSCLFIKQNEIVGWFLQIQNNIKYVSHSKSFYDLPHSAVYSWERNLLGYSWEKNLLGIDKYYPLIINSNNEIDFLQTIAPFNKWLAFA